MMNEYRLLRIAEELRSLPNREDMDGRFDLTTWAGSSELPWKGDQNLSCGTVFCAIGLACTIPEFQAAGLHLKPNLWRSKLASPAFNEFRDFDAVSHFLDISCDDVVSLFDPESYRKRCLPTDDPIVVAERIEEYVRDYE